MASTPIKTPGRGRSRFSKRLPAAPLEALSPASVAKHYLSSPLPPLPAEATPPPKAIPRRPVGGEKAAHSKAPSITSIPSDYSNSPVSRSRSSSDSDTSSSGSTKESPEHVVGRNNHHDDPKAAPRSRRDIDNRHGDSDAAPPPPLPPKDQKRRKVADTPASASALASTRSPRPTTPPHVLASPAAGFKPSPPPTEIWRRRRRSEKSENSITFPELKLHNSNGATASLPKRQEPPAAERSLPALPGQHPPRTTSRKPIPARPAPPQPYVMGNEIAKLKVRRARTNSGESSTAEDISTTGSGGPYRYGAPTSFVIHHEMPVLPVNAQMEPEKLKEEEIWKGQMETPPRKLAPSPVSVADEATPQLPLKSDARPLTNDPLPTFSITSSSEDSAILSSHSYDSADTVTIRSNSKIIDYYAESPSTEPLDASEIVTPRPSSLEEDETRSPPPLKISFPVYPKSLNLASTAFPTLPISIVHLDCYQAHRSMRKSKNTPCPVGCMVCQRGDTEIRWRCTFCCLSACESCMLSLTSIPGNDLRACLEGVEKSIAR